MASARNLFLLTTGLAMLVGILLPAGLAFMPWGAPRAELLTATLWLYVPFGIGGFVCASAYERGRARAWMIAGMASVLLGFVSWLPALWLPFGDPLVEASVFYLAPLTTATPSVFTLAGLLLQLRLRKPWARGVRLATIIVGALLAVWIVGAVWYFPLSGAALSWRREQAYIEFAMRFGSVIGIVAGCGLLTTFCASILPGLHNEPIPDAERLSFRATCPRCHAMQALRTEGDSCESCGLVIRVSIP